MTKYRKRLAGAASFGFLVLLMAGPAPAGAQAPPVTVTTDVLCQPQESGVPGLVTLTVKPYTADINPVATLNDAPPMVVPAAGGSMTTGLDWDGGYEWYISDGTLDGRILARGGDDNACGDAAVRALTVAPNQVSPPPTDPCPGCGPSGSKLPSGNARAWSYPEHRCLLTNGVNASNFSLVFGLNAAYPNPAAFTVTVDDVATATPLVSTPIGDVLPGQQRSTGTIVTVLPNTTIEMKVTARDTVTGAAIRFGDSSFVKTSQLTCDCVQPPATVPPSVSTVPPPSSTPPGTPTTPPVGASVPGGSTPPTVAFELPATGPSGNVLFVAVVILGIGAFLLIATRGLRDDLDDL